MNNDQLIWASATTLARLIREGQVSSSEVLKAYLARIDEVNPKLNAVVQRMDDEAGSLARDADAAVARRDPLGPLHGVPITIKDAWETEGVISTAGTTGRANYVGQADSTVVARMKAAGAIPIGMTNLPELSMAFESDNLVYGRTNNPYDLSRTPGGSGGGGAAIIAAGGSALEIGADMGGSVRLPCHFSGIAGLRVTNGRAPLTGYFPTNLGAVAMMAAPGPLARKVEDLALALPVICGPDWLDQEMIDTPLYDMREVRLPGLRAAFHVDNGIIAPTSDTADTVRAAAAKLADAGMMVEEARPTGIEQCLEIWLGLLGADGGEAFKTLLQMVGVSKPHFLYERVVDMVKPLATSAAGFGWLLARRDLYRRAMLGFLKNYDVILSPVCAFPAVPHGTSVLPDVFPGFSYTVAHNLTGWPGASVRCGTSPEGLPINVQVVARPFREDVALAVAAHLEAEMGGWQRPAM